MLTTQIKLDYLLKLIKYCKTHYTINCSKEESDYLIERIDKSIYNYEYRGSVYVSNGAYLNLTIDSQGTPLHVCSLDQPVKTWVDLIQNTYALRRCLQAINGGTTKVYSKYVFKPSVMIDSQTNKYLHSQQCVVLSNGDITHKDHAFRCDCCGECYLLSEKREGGYCNTCWTEGEVVECDHCGAFEIHDRVNLVEDKYYCPSCVDEHTGMCQECEELFLNDNLETIDDVTYCSQCIAKMSRCLECGRLISDTYDDGLCESCSSDIACYVLPYHHTRDHDLSSDIMYFGVELELECVSIGTRYKIAKTIDESCDNVILKFDGSLTYGLEITTDPFEFHESHDMLKPFLTILNKYDVKVDDNHIGIHIHISKKPLSTFEILRLSTIFNEHNTKFIELIARRSKSIYAKICNKTELDYEKTLKTPALYLPSGDRHKALNITNTTLEFRIFQSSISIDIIMGYLYFIKACLDICSDNNGYSIHNLFDTPLEYYINELDKKQYEPLFNYINYLNNGKKT